jgi:hypothetical protein
MWWKLVFMIASMNGDIVYKKHDIASYPNINECIQNIGSKELTENDLKNIPDNSKIVYSCNKI